MCLTVPLNSLISVVLQVSGFILFFFSSQIYLIKEDNVVAPYKYERVSSFFLSLSKIDEKWVGNKYLQH